MQSIHSPLQVLMKSKISGLGFQHEFFSLIDMAHHGPMDVRFENEIMINKRNFTEVIHAWVAQLVSA